jgi:hypothetical protein
MAKTRSRQRAPRDRPADYRAGRGAGGSLTLCRCASAAPRVSSRARIASSESCARCPESVAYPAYPESVAYARARARVTKGAPRGERGHPLFACERLSLLRRENIAARKRGRRAGPALSRPQWVWVSPYSVRKPVLPGQNLTEPGRRNPCKFHIPPDGAEPLGTPWRFKSSHPHSQPVWASRVQEGSGRVRNPDSSHGCAVPHDCRTLRWRGYHCGGSTHPLPGPRAFVASRGPQPPRE